MTGGRHSTTRGKCRGRRVWPVWQLFAVVVLIVTATSMSGQGRAEDADGLFERRIVVDGRERLYRVLPPRDPSRPLPVVVLLHGGTQSAAKIFGPRAGGTREWIRIAREQNFLLVAPNGANPDTGDGLGERQFWNIYGRTGSAYDPAKTVDDVAFIRAMLGALGREHRVDPRRVYVTGASNGGMMTYRLLIDAPELFAAGAAFIATLPADLSRVPRPPRPVPLMIYHGTADPLVPYEGGVVPGRWGRERGPSASGPATVAWWIAANRASREAVEVETLAHRDPSDPCRITRYEHRASRGGAPVTVYIAEGGGHAMPQYVSTVPNNFMVRRLIGNVCRDAEGARIAWDFMSAHRRP